ncbi:MAG TPA: DinB family protein [Acidimicrobiales bacterium]|nr:DinB family protein [Acidimicrobiales bacterium]
MQTNAVLLELYGRIPPLVRAVVEDLPAEKLVERPGPDANTIGWLLWHLARVQDHHVAELMGSEQVWAGGDWAGRVGLEPDPDNTGYGHSSEEVGRVRPVDGSAIVDYLDAVQARTVTFLEGLSDGDLDRIVDRRWDPPVTMGVRLVSIADDSLQHVGQAAYVKGLLA